MHGATCVFLGRGHAYDFDRWEKEGAKGWNYFSCLPYFKKAQKHQLGGDDYRGGHGPLHVSMRNWNNPLHEVLHALAIVIPFKLRQNKLLHL